MKVEFRRLFRGDGSSMGERIYSILVRAAAVPPIDGGWLELKDILLLLTDIGERRPNSRHVWDALVRLTEEKVVEKREFSIDDRYAAAYYRITAEARDEEEIATVRKQLLQDREDFLREQRAIVGSELLAIEGAMEGFPVAAHAVRFWLGHYQEGKLIEAVEALQFEFDRMVAAATAVERAERGEWPLSLR